MLFVKQFPTIYIAKQLAIFVAKIDEIPISIERLTGVLSR